MMINIQNKPYMHKYLNYIFIIGLLQLIISCETLREFEVPKEPDKLVIGGRFPFDSIMSILISKSRFIITPEIDYKYWLKNATVNVSEGGKIIDQLIFVDEDIDIEGFLPSLYVSASDFRPESGKTYSIEVNSAGFSSIYATTTIPPKVTIESILLENRKVEIVDGLFAFPISIEFNDPAAESNYYRVEAFVSTFTVVQGQVFSGGGTLAVAPELTQGQDLSNNNSPFFSGLYISDINFNGEKFKLDFFVETLNLLGVINQNIDPSDSLSAELSVVLKHITKEHYDFGVTSKLQDRVNDDPFSEPVPVKSNVTGGLGIFAGFSFDLISTEVPQ